MICKDAFRSLQTVLQSFRLGLWTQNVANIRYLRNQTLATRYETATYVLYKHCSQVYHMVMVVFVNVYAQYLFPLIVEDFPDVISQNDAIFTEKYQIMPF